MSENNDIQTGPYVVGFDDEMSVTHRESVGRPSRPLARSLCSIDARLNVLAQEVSFEFGGPRHEFGVLFRHLVFIIGIDCRERAIEHRDDLSQ